MPPDIRTGPPGLAGVLPPGRPAGLLAGPPEPPGLTALFASLLARSGGPTTEHTVHTAADSTARSRTEPEPPQPQRLKEYKDPLPGKQAANATSGGLLPPPPIQMRPPTPEAAARNKTSKNAMDTVPASPSPFRGIGAVQPVSGLPLPGAGTILSQAPPVFSGLLIPKPVSVSSAPPPTRAVAVPPVATASPLVPSPVMVAKAVLPPSVSASAFAAPAAVTAPAVIAAPVGDVGASLSAAAPLLSLPKTFAVSASLVPAQPRELRGATVAPELRLASASITVPNVQTPRTTAVPSSAPPTPNAVSTDAAFTGTAYTVAPQTVVVLMSSLEQTLPTSLKPAAPTADVKTVAPAAPHTAPLQAEPQNAVLSGGVSRLIDAAGLKLPVLPPVTPGRSAVTASAVTAQPAVIVPQAAVAAEAGRILRPAGSVSTSEDSKPVPAPTLKTGGASADTSTRTIARNAGVPAAPGKLAGVAELRLQVVGRRTERGTGASAPETAPILPSATAPTTVGAADKPLTHAERAEMVRQVTDGVGTMRLPARPGQPEQMTLQLHPKDWGKLQVSVQIAAPARPDGQMPAAARTQAVSAHVVAETPQVKAALESGAGELRQTLRAAGLHLDKLTVTVRAPGASSQAGTAAGGGHHFAGGGQTAPERGVSTPASGPTGGSNGQGASFASFANHPQGGGRQGAQTPTQAPEPDEDAPTPVSAPTQRRGQIDMRA